MRLRTCSPMRRPGRRARAAARVPSEPCHPREPCRPRRVPRVRVFLPSVHSEIDEGLLSEVPDSALFHEEAQALRETPLDQPFELRRQDSGDIETEPPVSVRAEAGTRAGTG